MRRRRLRQDRHSQPNNFPPMTPATKVVLSTSHCGATHSQLAQAMAPESLLDKMRMTMGVTTATSRIRAPIPRRGLGCGCGAVDWAGVVEVTGRE